MHSIERVHEILDEIAEEIPKDFYKGLTGGIVLLEDKKIHREAIKDDLYILGEYTRSQMGNYIKIYYGSFMAVYGHYSEEMLKKRLKETLIHEFIHHLEGRARLKDLEIEDRKNIEKYKLRNDKHE